MKHKLFDPADGVLGGQGRPNPRPPFGLETCEKNGGACTYTFVTWNEETMSLRFTVEAADYLIVSVNLPARIEPRTLTGAIRFVQDNEAQRLQYTYEELEAAEEKTSPPRAKRK
jgi:hypothetical protein